MTFHEVHDLELHAASFIISVTVSFHSMASRVACE